MTRVYPRDLRAARICFGGARPWFRRHGLDWQTFVANGIAAERLEATGDALAFRVTAEARMREAGSREAKAGEAGTDEAAHGR
jgi:hypothetical protein